MPEMIGSYMSYTQEEHAALMAAEFVQDAFLETPVGPVNPMHVVRGFVTKESGYHVDHDDLVTWFTACVEISSGRVIAVGPHEGSEADAQSTLNAFLKRAHTVHRSFWA